MLSIFALSALPGSALLAQNITGTWQGTLKVNGPNGSVDLRTVMKISRADDESLKGVFYSIDQGAAPINSTSITLKGSAVKISIAQLNGTFEGTLSGDGNASEGTGRRAVPHSRSNLVRATDETAWTIPEPPPPPVADGRNREAGIHRRHHQAQQPRRASAGGMASGARM